MALIMAALNLVHLGGWEGGWNRFQRFRGFVGPGVRQGVGPEGMEGAML